MQCLLLASFKQKNQALVYCETMQLVRWQDTKIMWHFEIANFTSTNHQKMLIFSAHGDTNFSFHTLQLLDNGQRMLGHLDNFAGVHCLLASYFAGAFAHCNYCRIEITYGEEKNFAGAKQVAKTVKATDWVIVIDVTATETTKHVVIEKCKNHNLYAFLQAHLSDMSVDLYMNCPDPIANEDETDVYSGKSAYCLFLGVPTQGGDYNEGPVETTSSILQGVQQVIARLVQLYPLFEQQVAIWEQERMAKMHSKKK